MLRVAFNKAVADPDFLKEAALQRLAIDPMSGNDAEQLINRLYRTPAAVLDRMRKIVQVTRSSAELLGAGERRDHRHPHQVVARALRIGGDRFQVWP